MAGLEHTKGFVSRVAQSADREWGGASEGPGVPRQGYANRGGCPDLTDCLGEGKAPPWVLSLFVQACARVRLQTCVRVCACVQQVGDTPRAALCSFTRKSGGSRRGCSAASSLNYR